MKAILSLLSVGVLTTQAAVFRPVAPYQIVPGMNDDELAAVFRPVAPYQIMPGMNGDEFVVTSEEEELFSLGNIGKSLNNIGKQITNTANGIANTVANDFKNGAGFSQAAGDWGNVNWQNGDGLIQAIQATALGCKTFYTDLNTLTGGNFNEQDLEAASLVASYVFPPAAIAVDAGQIVLTLGTKSQDITNLCEGINSGLKSDNYVQVAVDAFQLFQIIAQAAA